MTRAEKPIGYILVNPDTNAIDWDTTIYDTEEQAAREAGLEVYKDRLRAGEIDRRPDERFLMDYRVFAVVPCANADAKALAVLQAEWDRRERS